MGLSKFVATYSKDPGLLFKNLWRKHRPIRKEYRIWKKMNLYQWMIYHQKNVVYEKSHWMGIKAWKNPMDSWIYQEILYDVKPDVVIEIGSMEGGSTLFLANMLDLIGKGQVISIDINRDRYKAEHPRIVVLTGDSSSPEIVKKVSGLCKDKSVLVMHDGGHSRDQVFKDLEAYSGLVSVDSYFIVEDSIIDVMKPGDGIGSPGAGPLVAIDEFLRNNSNFIIDKTRERYIMTYNPNGFLKRIR